MYVPRTVGCNSIAAAPKKASVTSDATAENISATAEGYRQKLTAHIAMIWRARPAITRRYSLTHGSPGRRSDGLMRARVNTAAAQTAHQKSKLSDCFIRT